jgi:hypothetical protein
MAKTTGRRPRVKRESASGPAASPNNPSAAPRAEDTLVEMAEDLGKLLGTAQNRMEAWLGERQEIATKLVQIRDTANQYLRDLTAGGANIAAAIERGRRSAPKRPTSDSGGATSARKTSTRKTQK